MAKRPLLPELSTEANLHVDRDNNALEEFKVKMYTLATQWESEPNGGKYAMALYKTLAKASLAQERLDSAHDKLLAFQGQLFTLAETWQTKPDSAECAVTIYKILVKSQFIDAQVPYAKCLQQGLGCIKDEKAALDWLETAAMNRDGEAQYLLGKHYENRKENHKALQYYLDSMNNEYDEAQSGYDRCMNVIFSDIDKISNNQTPASENLEYLLFGEYQVDIRSSPFNQKPPAHEEGTPDKHEQQDSASSASLETPEDEENNQPFQADEPSSETSSSTSEQQTTEEVMFDLAAEWEKDPAMQKAALELYQRLAENEHPYAQYRYYICLEQGIGCEIDEEGAVSWLHTSAENGNRNAEYTLGTYYHHTEKNIEEAKKWYLKSANQNFPEAQFALAQLYMQQYKATEATADSEHPADTEINPLEQAVYWYGQAAACNYTQAQYKLAKCSWKGIGVEKDLDKAIHLLKSSERKNHIGSIYALGYIYKYEEAMYNPTLAFTHFKKAAELGNTNAMFETGECYRLGTGTPINVGEAIRYYHNASEQRHELATERLGTSRNHYNSSSHSYTHSTPPSPVTHGGYSNSTPWNQNTQGQGTPTQTWQNRLSTSAGLSGGRQGGY